MTQTVYLENSSIKKSWVPIKFFSKSGRDPRCPGGSNDQVGNITFIMETSEFIWKHHKYPDPKDKND